MKKSKKKRAPTRLELAYHPELYRFVSPVFVLDEISAAMMVGLRAADRLAYYGFTRAVSRIMEHLYIHPDEVQEIYRHNVGRPVPPLFQAYADALAVEKVKLARGRKPPTDMDQRWEELAQHEFRRVQHWLTERPEVQKRADAKRVAAGLEPLKRRRRSCTLPWKETGPYELASRVVARRFYPDGDAKSLQNRRSKHGGPARQPRKRELPG